MSPLKQGCNDDFMPSLPPAGDVHRELVTDVRASGQCGSGSVRALWRIYLGEGTPVHRD
jgi:hypothetical protein